MKERKPAHSKPKNFHQLNGLTIIYEDRDIIVINKAAGLLTMGTDREKQKTAHYLLNQYVKKGNERSKNRIYIVHRLDRDTSGLLVFAKSENAKHFLQENWKTFSKKYYAVVHGHPDENEDVITSYLMENKALRVYSTRDKENGKLAKTAYTVINESENFSLLELELLTGRKNQIRVHLYDIGHPVVGDKTYSDDAKEFKRLALHSAYLSIQHPVTKKEMVFTTGLPDYFKKLMK